MTREKATEAYHRVLAWEQRQSKQLRDEILVAVFGGCGCRAHNCQVSFDVRQHQIWDKANKLAAVFAKHF